MAGTIDFCPALESPATIVIIADTFFCLCARITFVGTSRQVSKEVFCVSSEFDCYAYLVWKRGEIAASGVTTARLRAVHLTQPRAK